MNNSGLTYSSTEGEVAIKELQMEVNGIVKMGKRKKHK
jgi:hypothetical protein